MSPIARLTAALRGRRARPPALLAGWVLVLALAQALPADAQKGGAPGSKDGCTPPRSGRIPDELRPFVLPGTRALCAARADLDADGLPDYVLVLEEADERAAAGDDLSEAPRPLLVVVREPGGALRVAKRNDQVVPCAACGGMFVDPFVGVEAGPGTFTVYDHAGVSARWQEEYTFRYVRSAGTWRLAQVVVLTYDPATPQRVERRIFVVDDFGDIDLADFDSPGWNPASNRD